MTLARFDERERLAAYQRAAREGEHTLGADEARVTSLTKQRKAIVFTTVC